MKISQTNHSIFAQTNQFKTNLIAIRFFSTISKDNATPYAILPDILTSGTINHPTRRDLTKAFEALYDTRLRFSVTRQGPTRMVQISLEYLQTQYLDESIEEVAFQYLHDVLYQPRTINGVFDSAIVEREKRLFLEDYEARFEDKSYVSNRAFKGILFDTDPYGIDVYGDASDLDTITPQRLWDTYQELLQSPAQVIVVANDYPVSLDQFQFERNTLPFVDRVDVCHEPVQFSTHLHHSKQAMFHVAYTTSVRYDEPLYYPMLLLDSLFGGDQSSLLFMNIREERHLAYSVYSQYQPAKGLLAVTVGLQASAIPNALAAIQEQLQTILDGGFTDESLTAHKKIWSQQVKTVFDTPGGIAAKLGFDSLLQRPLSVTHAIEMMQQVTKEDIVAAAKTLRLDTVFALADQEVEWND